MVHLDLIYAMIAVGCGLGAYYWAGRKNLQSSVRLRMSRGWSAAQSLSTKKMVLSQDQESKDTDMMLRSKNLNVMFMFNAHHWDAYEVLGIPAGSNLAAIEKAHIETLARTNSQSHDFVKAAYQAIIKDLGQESGSSKITRKI